jgi:hypothetical protein
MALGNAVVFGDVVSLVPLVRFLFVGGGEENLVGYRAAACDAEAEGGVLVGGVGTPRLTVCNGKSGRTGFKRLFGAEFNRLYGAQGDRK